MEFPIKIDYQIPELYQSEQQSITLYTGLTVFVGPNGSGKTQVLRSIKNRLEQYTNGRAVRYISAGRLSHLENFRSDYDGRRGGARYEDAQFGGKDHRQYRLRAETAFGDFHTLSIKPDLQIKVAERLRTLFKRDIYIDWDAGNLKVNFKRNDIKGKSYSSAREASGLLQLVVILAAIYDNEVGALLLDEPEISLHPQLQSFLLREIQNISGEGENKKIIIISTHSTEMINICRTEDISNIIFFTDSTVSPKQVLKDAGELKNKKLNALLARIGQSDKLAFFSARPLLVEGPSDVIICNYLDNRLNLYLSAAGSQVLPVIGKGQMPIVAKFMTLIGKTPIILTDLDSVADGLDLVNSISIDETVEKELQESGHESFIKFTQLIYNDFCKIINEKWNDIKIDAVKHPYWINRDENNDEKIYKKRAAMAVLLNYTQQEIENLNNSSYWKPMRSRLISLFDCLEKTGCFVLRKGSIESYYKFVDNNTTAYKPNAAVEEIESLNKENINYIESNYSDIVHALRFASDSPKIDEAAAVSDLLLAVVTPALNRLCEDTTDASLESMSQQIIGERSSLFQMSKELSDDKKIILAVNLKSDILHIEGFPIKFDKDCNPLKEVRDNIR